MEDLAARESIFAAHEGTMRVSPTLYGGDAGGRGGGGGTWGMSSVAAVAVAAACAGVVAGYAMGAKR